MIFRDSAVFKLASVAIAAALLIVASSVFMVRSISSKDAERMAPIKAQFPSAFTNPTYNQNSFDLSQLKGKTITNSTVVNINYGYATILEFSDGSKFVIQAVKYPASFQLVK